MSIPPDSLRRGAAAFLPQPVNENDQRVAQCMVETIYYFNARCTVTPSLADIEYRSSDGDLDIRRHVFRWDRASYDFVFQHGFEARRQANTRDEAYYNLEHYVNSGGRPLDTRRDTTHCFISTTISSSWYPRVSSGAVDYVYRYEIYAPGGIWVAETLGERYRYHAQDEIAFPAGIAPQYIRSAQLFVLTSDGEYTIRTRANNILYINRNFNPQSHPQREIRIEMPVVYYDDYDTMKRLTIEEFPQREKIAVATSNADIIEYYIEGVTTIESYLDSAFRSTIKNEAYFFFQNQYVLLNYAPGTMNDRVVNGPLYIPKGYHSLVGTPFAAYGIDAAFGCHGRRDESFIFSGSICAKINYAPGTANDKILEGPKTIKQMFPFFKGTKFEKGVDAAFESSVPNEVYIFKGGEYARVDCIQRKLIARRPIVHGFNCLQNTIFVSNIGAAFASHKYQEAYLFKEKSYVILHFTPGETKDYIITGPKEFVPFWPSLVNILPRDNAGLDIYEGPGPDPERGHDEL